MKITFVPCHISKIWQQNRILLVRKPYTQNLRSIHLEMKENIHFNQRFVSSYALQSGYLWYRIFLLSWQQHPPNINFWLGMFRKCMLLPSPAFRFWDRAFWIKICREITDFVVSAFTTPSPLWTWKTKSRMVFSRQLQVNVLKLTWNDTLKWFHLCSYGIEASRI